MASRSSFKRFRVVPRLPRKGSLKARSFKDGNNAEPKADGCFASFDGDSGCVAPEPGERATGQDGIGGFAQLGEADLFFAQAALQELSHAALAFDQTDQAVCPAFLDAVTVDLFGEAEQAALVDAGQMLIFVPAAPPFERACGFSLISARCMESW